MVREAERWGSDKAERDVETEREWESQKRENERARKSRGQTDRRRDR